MTPTTVKETIIDLDGFPNNRRPDRICAPVAICNNGDCAGISRSSSEVIVLPEQVGTPGFVVMPENKWRDDFCLAAHDYVSVCGVNAKTSTTPWP